MATLTIRNLDDGTKSRLRVAAAHHGRSMEEHARVLLDDALRPVGPPQAGGLGSWIHSLVADLGDDSPVLDTGERSADLRPVELA